MVPSPSVPLPFSIALVAGGKTTISVPAFATGNWFTVTWTVALPVAPLLSVTLNLNLYTPCTNAVIAVEAELALVIEPDAGPETFAQLYDAMVPSGSVPLPNNVVEFVGNVKVTSLPALAVGG